MPGRGLGGGGDGCRTGPEPLIGPLSSISRLGRAIGGRGPQPSLEFPGTENGSPPSLG